jgi:hypothetical protein
MLINDDDTAVLASSQGIFTEEGFKVTTTKPSEGIESWQKATNTQSFCATGICLNLAE